MTESENSSIKASLTIIENTIKRGLRKQASYNGVQNQIKGLKKKLLSLNDEDKEDIIKTLSIFESELKKYKGYYICYMRKQKNKTNCRIKKRKSKSKNKSKFDVLYDLLINNERINSSDKIKINQMLNEVGSFIRQMEDPEQKKQARIKYRILEKIYYEKNHPTPKRTTISAYDDNNTSDWLDNSDYITKKYGNI